MPVMRRPAIIQRRTVCIRLTGRSLKSPEEDAPQPRPFNYA